MVIKILICLFSFFLFCVIVNLMDAIASYFKEKRNSLYMTNNKIAENKTSLNLTERLDVTLNLLNLIDILIDNEIAKKFQACIRLNVKYETSKLDKDVEIISRTVYEALKKDIYLNNDLILSDEFIMQHITDEVLLKMIQTGKEINLALLTT